MFAPNEPQKKRQKVDYNTLSSNTFNDKLLQLLQDGNIVCNSEEIYDWKVMKLSGSQIIMNYKHCLTETVNKLINDSNDRQQIISCIISYIFTTDRIISCMEYHSDIYTNAKSIDYHNIDLIYHEIIKHG
eukprot:184687_1